jgi:predicted nucleic acid-binding protein
MDCVDRPNWTGSAFWILALVEWALVNSRLRLITPSPTRCSPFRGFEIFAYAGEGQAKKLRAVFDHYRVLEAPEDLWERATVLGRACSLQGEPAEQMDLIIAAIALYHDAEVVTFDVGMAGIANYSKLRVKLLERPEVP